MKTYLECLKEAAEILERPYTYAYIKHISTEETEKLFNKAADIYASQSNSHKHGVMQTLPFQFVEWYSGMQKEKIESAYKRWMKEGNVAVGQRSVGTNAEAGAFNCVSSESLVYNRPCKEWCGNTYCKSEAPSGGHL